LRVRQILLRVLLTVLFYVLVAPISLVLKVLGYDPLALRRPSRIRSYWVIRNQNSKE
jgi:hypothetical protein